jgi:2-polyprenyl-3-methyl-5-hydroxy-6-metoxy-1,4-benzoquinol methylase
MSKYIGTELELFQYCLNWKKYFSSFIIPFLGDNVAEIGSGIGISTNVLCKKKHSRWLCVEPDHTMANVTLSKIKNHLLPDCCTVYNGFSNELEDKFDSVLYIDVIEHIEDDRGELNVASELLNKNGKLFILVPAHQFLFSPFDKSIGHYRRYNRKMLVDIIPDSLQIESVRYFDSIGFFLSLGNQILKSRMPTQKQLSFWDRKIVPMSKIFDPLTGYKFGKSLLLVATKK